MKNIEVALGHRQVDQGHAFDVTQQLVGTITKVQQPLAVAGRVIRHPMREVCAVRALLVQMLLINLVT